MAFVTLNKKILQWRWYKDLSTKTLFIHLLLTAAHEETTDKWYGVTLRRGQTIASSISTNKKCGLTVRQYRTSLLKLQKTSEVTIKATNRFSIITICNYEKYQAGATSRTTSKATNSATSKATTYNKYNKTIHKFNNADANFEKNYTDFKDLPNPFDI